MMEPELLIPSAGMMLGISIGCALWAAGIAGSKQRSMLLFGGLGFMLWMIGVLIAVVVSPPEPPRAPYTPFAHPRRGRRGATPASSR